RILLAGLLVMVSAPTQAGRVLDRVRADGSLHCGAVARPGIAEAEGSPTGVLVDLCRAVAVAVLGRSARASFSVYESRESYDAVRQGTDEIGFLTGGEIAEQGLAPVVAPGPTVLISTVGVMVPDTSPVQQLTDLAGQSVCLMIGSRAQRALESAADRRHLAISRLTFEEDVELLDAYNAGNCGAAMGEDTYLADMRQNPGIRRMSSRFLPDTLAADPIIAATPRSDGDWTATIGWVIDALMVADAPADRWAGSAPAADLRPGWQRDVSAAVGSYGAIIRRNLTARLGLPPGPNALWPAGMLLPPAVK
ncbi:MAG TPA: transporter substrate-binding domain-containing protein, partial [Acetobacteraceae bacterium]|nr:transporter substrate-binding domain-containing protein [Acetobacteraceae bacterium]